MEQALICRAIVSPHPNADRLQLASVSGYSVVVGLETQDGELGIFFSSELRLSDAYLAEHDLVTRKDEEGNRAGGYFAENGRVRAQKLRGIKSEGYFAPLSSLEFTGGDISALKEGDQLLTFNGVELCEKYVSQATLRAMMRQGQQKRRKDNPYFHQHMDTDQLRHKGAFIKPGDLLTMTYKMHGTSARTGRLLETRELPRKWHQKVLRKPAKVVTEYQVINGTRRVVLADGQEDGWYIGETFRRDCSARFADLLREGETVYYEIVGYTGSGQPLMGQHSLDKTTDKEAHKLYGKTITYSYGCGPGEFAIYVYRITQAHSDPAHPVELSWPQVKKRCVELGLRHVVEVANSSCHFGFLGLDGLTEMAEGWAEGPDPIDPRHPKEGVVIRVDGADGHTWFLKQKGWLFRILEGLLKEDDSFVDIEEAS